MADADDAVLTGAAKDTDEQVKCLARAAGNEQVFGSTAILVGKHGTQPRRTYLRVAIERPPEAVAAAVPWRLVGVQTNRVIDLRRSLIGL